MKVMFAAERQHTNDSLIFAQLTETYNLLNSVTRFVEAFQCFNHDGISNKMFFRQSALFVD